MKLFSHKEFSTKEQQLIDIFEDVRDNWKFYLPKNIKDCSHTCVHKHEVLKHYLEQAGYRAKNIAVKFKWSNQTFPPNVKKHLNKFNDDEYHFFLQVELDGHLQNIDCTFEKTFIKYNKWNTKEPTKIAVKQYGNIIYDEEAEEKVKLYQTREFWESRLETTINFYNSANKFFEILKKTPGPAKFITQKAFEYFERKGVEE